MTGREATVECSSLFPCEDGYRCAMHRTVRVWPGSRTSRPDAFDRALDTGRETTPCDLSVNACCTSHDGGKCDPSRRTVCHRHARRTIRDPLAPAVDRGLTGDHRLCSLDPCSECR